MIAGFANKAVVNFCFGASQQSLIPSWDVGASPSWNKEWGTNLFFFFFLEGGKNYPALKERLALVVLVGIISYRSTELSCHSGGVSCACWAAGSFLFPLVRQFLIPHICTRAHMVTVPVHICLALGSMTSTSGERSLLWGANLVHKGLQSRYAALSSCWWAHTPLLVGAREKHVTYVSASVALLTSFRYIHNSSCWF